MGYAGDIRHVKHCRKPYSCDWCCERIDIDSKAVTWGWFDNGTGTTVRVHPECHEAMLEMDEPGEFYPGENRRGCNCGRDGECERCRENERIRAKGESG